MPPAPAAPPRSAPPPARGPLPPARDAPPRGADPLPTKLRAKLGAIPPGRVVLDPPPGTATWRDADRHRDRTGRLAELIDGTLIEKAVSDLSIWFDGEIFGLLRDWVKPRKLGYVHPASGFFHFPDGLRAPDAAFTPRARRPEGLQARGYSNVPPALVAEVWSPGNTRTELDAKRALYFAAGVEVVWEVFPLRRAVTVWERFGAAVTLLEPAVLTGGAALPGFAVPLRELFADPLADAEPRP